MKWMVGEVQITRVEESVAPFSRGPADFFVGFERSQFDEHVDWMTPTHYRPRDDRIISSIHSWLIRTPHHTILLDTCTGNHRNRPWNKRFHQLNTPFLERLEEAGAVPEDIDIVLCTHLHTDHCGWNTRLQNGRWVPTFPNARYLFSRLENEFWNPYGDDASSSAAFHQELYEDSVLPVLESGQAVMLDGAHAIDDSLLIEPSPGHTPGHVHLTLTDSGQTGIFCGDVIHHPVQLYRHEWNSCFCEAQDQARESRRRVLDHCAESGGTLFPAHFAAPHVVTITGTAAGYVPTFIPPRAA